MKRRGSFPGLDSDHRLLRPDRLRALPVRLLFFGGGVSFKGSLSGVLGFRAFLGFRVSEIKGFTVPGCRVEGFSCKGSLSGFLAKGRV